MLGRNGRIDDIESVRRHVRAKVARRARKDDDLAPYVDQAEALLSTLEFRSTWRRLRVVARTAQIETDHGISTFSDELVLPDVRHTFDLVLAMLNYQRTQNGLPEAKMPLFVQPDEIGLASRAGVLCLCEDEAEVEARARQLRRLGRHRFKRWQRTRRRVFDRDDWKCTECGAERDIHIHRVDQGGSMWSRDTWVTLCRTHHVVPARRVPDPDSVRGIRSQLALVIKKGKIEWTGLVFGEKYFLLRN